MGVLAAEEQEVIAAVPLRQNPRTDRAVIRSDGAVPWVSVLPAVNSVSSFNLGGGWGIQSGGVGEGMAARCLIDCASRKKLPELSGRPTTTLCSWARSARREDCRRSKV